MKRFRATTQERSTVASPGFLGFHDVMWCLRAVGTRRDGALNTRRARVTAVEPSILQPGTTSEREAAQGCGH